MRGLRFSMVLVSVVVGLGCQADNPQFGRGIDFSGELPDLAVIAGADQTVAGDSAAVVDLAFEDLAFVPRDQAMPDVAMVMADLRPPPPPDLAGPRDLTAVPDLVNSCPMASKSCYAGAMKTQNVGACRDGTSFCINGVFGPCVGQIVPAPESCNNADDDCNGMVDDGLGTVACGIGACRVTVNACVAGKPNVCTPGMAVMELCGDNTDNNCDGQIDEGCGCVYVSPTGNDNNPGTAQSPKRTIVAAIAVAGTNGLPKLVCVASGLACPSNTTFKEDVVMRDGVSVYGGYQAAGNVWPRTAGCVTTVAPNKPVGVYFDKSIAGATVLDGFTILAHNDPTSAAVTVEGSAGALVSNNVITGGGTATSYGVNIIDSGGVAATPTLYRNAVSGGNGSMLSVGVRSLNSAPVIQSHCNTLDAAGRCNVGCFVATLFIRGRIINTTGTDTYGVRLENSPNADISQSAICGFGASGNVAGVRVSGNGTGVSVRTSLVTAGGAAMQAAGVWADPCNGASPWLLNNTQLGGNSSLLGGRADGVRAIGDCHPRVDSNLLVVGGQESANNDANGVYCARDANSKISSRCTVLGNTEIRGAGAGFPPTATGVRCDDGACARIEKNGLITARSAQRGYGIRLGATDTFVNANRIDGGCSLTEGTGIWASDSYARIQNNQISGVVGGCPNGMISTAPSFAVRIFNGAGPNEVDLHSNDLFPGGSGNCTGRGLAFDVIPGGQPPAGPLGVVRNNIISAGICATRYAVEEQSALADPRIFENNDLFAFGFTALYRDEAAANLMTTMQVNGMKDVTVASNLSADPLLNAANKIPANSPCNNAGTATGAPANDFEGEARPQQNLFDIGWDEYRP